MALGVQDLLAWADITSVESAWLFKLTRADWLEPFAGLGLVILGIFQVGPAWLSLLSLRDEDRKRARRSALFAALVAGVAGLLAFESLIPSREALPFIGDGTLLTKGARQGALLGLVVCIGAIAAFILLRRRDVGFRNLSVPIQRQNEIWQVRLKIEIAVRAVPRNEEACKLAEQRVGFIQARVGASFDQFCEPLVKESADLSTIDNTARLQMDVGHVFKRYADFHRRLASKRHDLCEDLMQAAHEATVDLLERKLPGQSLRVGMVDGVNVSISHPELADTLTLQNRRDEWDETLRTIVSIGAEKGNEIVGEWIQRAARGEVSVEEVPAAVEALRGLCQRNGRSEKETMDEGRLLAV